MEKELQQVVELLNQMNEKIDTKLTTIESRLERLEKVDSIEHRVTVNQIDISDIKELLQKLEESSSRNVGVIIEEAIARFEKTYHNQLEFINTRLDCQLLKIAKTEEEILMQKKQKS